MIAHMLLARAGKQAIPLLLEAANRRKNLPLVLLLLGEVGDQSLSQQISRFEADDDPQVAEAARDAFRILNAGSVPQLP